MVHTAVAFLWGLICSPRVTHTGPLTGYFGLSEDKQMRERGGITGIGVTQVNEEASQMPKQLAHITVCQLGHKGNELITDDAVMTS